MEVLVKNLVRICKAQKKPLAEVNRACGFGTRSIYSWDKHAPTVDRVKKVADYLGVTVDELLAEPEAKEE